MDMVISKSHHDVKFLNPEWNPIRNPNKFYKFVINS